MDPTTAAHTSQPLHHSHLQTGVDSTGMPTLNTGAPYAGVGSQTSPGAPLTSSPSVGTSNLAAPKSSAPAADPIAGLSAPAPANSNQSPSTTTDKLNTTAANAKDSALNAKDKAADQASAAATGIRKRLNSISSSVEGAADHPTVKNVKVEAEKQVQGLREQLGRFPIVVEAEKKTGVDRVALVIGGVLLYIIMIPLNLLGLALPTTQLLTFLPPSALAIRTLDRPNEERTKTLLSYFVVFGFVQFAESLMAGFLERKIPQYYTVKLVFLAYLIHPKTKGARKIHASVLRPLLAKAQGQSTSSTSSSSSSTTTYPTTGTHTPPSHTARSSDSSVGAGAGAGLGSSTSPIPVAGGAPQPLSRAGGFSGTGPSEPLPSTGRVAQGFNL